MKFVALSLSIWFFVVSNITISTRILERLTGFSNPLELMAFVIGDIAIIYMMGKIALNITGSIRNKLRGF